MIKKVGMGAAVSIRQQGGDSSRGAVILVDMFHALPSAGTAPSATIPGVHGNRPGALLEFDAHV